MTFRRIGTRLFAALMMLMMTAMPALAAGGTLTVRVHSGETGAAKAVIALYRVGDAQTEDANRTFAISAAFAGSGETLSDLNDKALPGRLLAYAREKGLLPDHTGVTGEDGRVVFAELPEGAYLVCQTGFEGNGGFTQIDPFVVTMPMTVDGEWSSDITAEPKVDVVVQPTATPAPTEAPTDTKLPQSGLLRWPVLALSVGGVLMFALGWALCFMGKRKKDA